MRRACPSEPPPENARATSTVRRPAHCSTPGTATANSTRPSIGPAPRTRGTRVPGRAVAAIVVAVVAVGATALYANRGGDNAPEPIVAAEQVPALGAPGEPEPIVVETYDPVSPEGIRDFLHRYRDKFGDLQVDDVTFYPAYVFFTRALPNQPHLAQKWSFQGGFSISGAPDKRPLDTATVDLAALDVDRLADVLATGPARVGLLPAKVGYIFVRPDSPDGALVSVVFEDQDERTSGAPGSPRRGFAPATSIAPRFAAPSRRRRRRRAPAGSSRWRLPSSWCAASWWSPRVGSRPTRPAPRRAPR